LTELTIRKRNILGLGPVVAKEGDEMWFLQGAWVPYLGRMLFGMGIVSSWERHVSIDLRREKAFARGVLNKMSAIEVVLQCIV
jgi:hypothetical protein